MNRNRHPAAMCPACTHENGHHTRPGGRCGVTYSPDHPCLCPGFPDVVAPWLDRDYSAAWALWDADHDKAGAA